MRFTLKCDTYPVCLSAWNYPEEEADMHSVRKKAGWDYSEPVNSVIVLCIRRRPAEHLPVQANLDTADRVNRRWRRRNEEEKVKISRKATLDDHSFHLSQQSQSRAVRGREGGHSFYNKSDYDDYD